MYAKNIVLRIASFYKQGNLHIALEEREEESTKWFFFQASSWANRTSFNT